MGITRVAIWAKGVTNLLTKSPDPASIVSILMEVMCQGRCVVAQGVIVVAKLHLLHM